VVKTCTHGKSWTEPCLRCELVGKREFVAEMAPRVERAKERIQELERSILADREHEAHRIALAKVGVISGDDARRLEDEMERNSAASRR